MPKQVRSHYSPVFANRPWANAKGYISYYRSLHDAEVRTQKKGPKQWGRHRGLYSQKVEAALATELESKASRLYAALLSGKELNPDDRLHWAQFLLSQFVRTPTFLRYERAVRRKLGLEPPIHDRVGCKHCGDLIWVTSRQWSLVLAHPDDFFIRTDNPVLLSGFVERPESFLLYPLSPRLSFLACSMPSAWRPQIPVGPAAAITGVRLKKGGAHFINFHLARLAGESLVLSPDHDGEIASVPFKDVLGIYPQPPFCLHAPAQEEIPQAFESIRKIMSYIDGIEYPSWLPFELEPFPIPP